MEVRYTADQLRYERMSTQELRASFMLENLFKKDKINLVYTDADRAIIGGGWGSAAASMETQQTDQMAATIIEKTDLYEIRYMVPP